MTVPARRPSHERRVLVLALVSPFISLSLALALLWTSSGVAPFWCGTLSALLVAGWLLSVFALKRRVARALQSIANLLAALSDGDFSVRGHETDGADALSEALAQINRLADTLENQRMRAIEASALLAKVIAEIDVAVFAFDEKRNLQLVNRAGERLLAAPKAALSGASASALGVAALLEGETPRTIESTFPSGHGQWELRRSAFRLGGLTHELLVVSDLRRALREEERQAWQRIVRVLGHEINNSLAPIQSLAGDLAQILSKPTVERFSDWEEDLGRGLAIIERRSASLGRFMASYARLAKLPPPRFGHVEVSSWLHRVVELEQRMAVELSEGPELTISGDADQLDQLLINLVKNGVEAALETGGGVQVRWQVVEGYVEIVIADEGPGVADTLNLFVPFFTTKPDGSGVGLVLCRQIAEAHHGTLTLTSRTDRKGALACLRLPA